MDESKNYKIYRYVESDAYPLDEAPIRVDYVKGLDVSLEKVITMHRGDVIRVEHYESVVHTADGNKTGSDLILDEVFNYADGPTGNPVYRLQTITWYREDGTPGQQKQRPKHYDVLEGMKAGERRRTNRINHLKANAIGMIAATQTNGDMAAAILLGTLWMDKYTLDVAAYIKQSTPTLASKVSVDTETWLDNMIAPGVTIRMFILGEL